MNEDDNQMASANHKSRRTTQIGRVSAQQLALSIALVVVLPYDGIAFDSLSTLSTSSTLRPLNTPKPFGLDPLLRHHGSLRLSSVDRDDGAARSQFGTHEYWDELYEGRGDFPSDEYSWYFDFRAYRNTLGRYLKPQDEPRILLPGIGNDPVLLDLLQAGFRNMTATDYTKSAIERQKDILLGANSHQYGAQVDSIELCVSDCRAMPGEWTDQFDVIMEKGCIDAIYLSGDQSLQMAAKEFRRVLRPGGLLISVSGVVPTDMRERAFHADKWTWLVDGSEELKAGCFVLKLNAD